MKTERTYGIAAASIAALLGLGSVLWSPPLWAQPPEPAAIPAEIPETGETHEALAPLDEMMRAFLREQQIPGAALAVARDGHLVYARGFGYADVTTREPVQPDSLFRIASISKPLTAVAIMQLVERKRLALDQPILPLIEQRPHLPEGQGEDPRWQQITVRHLLQHTAGWDRDQSLDPMFQSVHIAGLLGTSPPAGPNEVIRFMRGWSLDFDPGARYAYSNFGYCLLGRIIERISGTGYEDHVRNQVLAPLGIESMRVGRTTLDGRAAKEVKYYTRDDRVGFGVFPECLGQRVPRPYGAWHLEAMDAHGGWIASATDLVRFGSAVQHDPQSLSLSAATAAAMFAPPEGLAATAPQGPRPDVHYGLGWIVRPIPAGDAAATPPDSVLPETANASPPASFHAWHTGSLDGTSTMLVLRSDGLCWAVLFNTRDTPEGGVPSAKIDPLIHQAADRVTAWPLPDHLRTAPFQRIP